MNTIKCPKCGETFTVSENDFREILSQVRDDEFNKELNSRIDLINKNHELDVQTKILNERQKNEDKVNELSKKIADLEVKLQKTINDDELKLSHEVDAKLAEINILENEINNLKNEQAKAISDAIKDKDFEIQKLNTDISNKNKDIVELELAHKKELQLKDDYINEIKNFKKSLSTKMIGESLEQYCLNEFNKIRMTAFPNASFEKDNEVIDNTKGDFIYKEFTPEGAEVISIMFEMKNEDDETKTKHKNEDFFEKLDKDRKKKNCEYAILCSMLEGDSDLYNQGIVDVSYKYDKMYVIRPQFFIPIISILRNAALANTNIKNELVEYKKENIDITDFENKLNQFQIIFGKHFESFAKNYEESIKDIDKAIEQLTKVKDVLTKSGNQLRLANDKAQDLSIKKLTYGNPTMKKKFDELKENN